MSLTRTNPNARDPFAALPVNPAGGPTQALTYGEFARAFAALGRMWPHSWLWALSVVATYASGFALHIVGQ
ncbi:hypothetical protein A4F85_19350 [Delftia sp. GW456-R20]|nr:hypothetical protein A4F85_19350 [Delftia sp. GW456-R20]